MSRSKHIKPSSVWLSQPHHSSRSSHDFNCFDLGRMTADEISFFTCYSEYAISQLTTDAFLNWSYESNPVTIMLSCETKPESELHRSRSDPITVVRIAKCKWWCCWCSGNQIQRTHTLRNTKPYERCLVNYSDWLSKYQAVQNTSAAVPLTSKVTSLHKRREFSSEQTTLWKKIFTYRRVIETSWASISIPPLPHFPAHFQQ